MEDKDLESRLYDKSYTCPVCDKKFKNKEIKKGKTIFVEMNLGLRGKFKPIMPDYYYVVMCDECGYAAVSKTFNKTTQKQAKKLEKKLIQTINLENIILFMIQMMLLIDIK